MSKLEALLAFQLKAARIPFEREVRFCERRYRIDFLVRGKLAVEVMGGTWIAGGHSRGAGYARDCEKAYLVALHGLIWLPVTGDDVKKGLALQRIEQLLKHLPTF